jgi:hypothetical protein
MDVNQAKLKSTLEEKMNAAMQSMGSEADETIQHRIEMTKVNLETQSPDGTN